MIGIYKITSPSKKVYIGQSVNIEIRFKHYTGLHNCKGQTILYNSFLKYGVEKHNFEILCECEASELNDKERFYQDLYSVVGFNGLNCLLTKSSDRSGFSSAETVAKMKIANKFKRVGKKHTEETKKKLSEISRINVIGRIHSEETKRKIGLAHIGNNHNLGSKRNEISKINMSKAQMNNHSCKKIIMDTQTGVFFLGISEASITYNINKTTLGCMLSGNDRNKTNLIYV